MQVEISADDFLKCFSHKIGFGNLHEMANPILWEIIMSLSSTEFAKNLIILITILILKLEQVKFTTCLCAKNF